MQIQIPLKDSDKKVVIETQNLPILNDLLQFLAAELPPLEIWHCLAVEYYRSKRIHEFKQILQTGTSNDLEKMPQYKDCQKQRIQMLNALAAFYYGSASREPDNQKREEFFTIATNYIARADRIDLHEITTWVGKGFLLIAKNSIENASYYFDNATQKDRTCIPAFLGKAQLYYTQENYKKALEFYQQVLQEHPCCPVGIRVAIGLCFYKLGKCNRALIAFKRVAQLDPSNSYAMIAISYIEFSKISQEHEKLKVIEEAYKANPSNPLILILIAQHYFLKQDFQNCIKYCNSCISFLPFTEQVQRINDICRIKAEANYFIARCNHAQGQYDQAFKMYHEAIKLNPNHYLSQYGIGQLLIRQHELKKALEMFKSVEKNCPKLYEHEVNKMIGFVCAKLQQNQSAKEKLWSVMDYYNSEDVDTCLQLASITQEPQQALQCYEKALSKLKGEESAELWNNIGVLRQQTGQTEGAKQALNEAKKLVSSPSNTKQMAVAITIDFNLARWYEEQSRFGEAIEIYRKIIENCSEYGDAYLRLAILAKKRGNFQRAIEHTEKAIKKIKKFTNGFCQIAQLFHQMGDGKKAMSWYNKTINDVSTYDSYALLGTANLYFEQAIMQKRNAQKKEEFLDKSLQYYIKVLKQDEKNIYAAIGVAQVVAQKGQLPKAQEIIRQVREAQPNNPVAMLKQGYFFYLQNKYENAIDIYRKIMEKYPKMEHLQLYEAQALYAAKRFDESNKTLRRLCFKYPHNFVYRYNLALVMQQQAFHFMQKQRREVEETRRACMLLEDAIPIFQYLGEARQKINSRINQALSAESQEIKKNKLSYILETAVVWEGTAKMQLEQCQKYLEIDIAEEENIKTKKQQLQQQQQKIMESLKQEQQLQEMRRIEEIKKKQQIAEANEKRQQELTQQWIQQGEIEQTTQKGNKKRQREDDNFINNYESEEGESNASENESFDPEAQDKIQQSESEEKESEDDQINDDFEQMAEKALKEEKDWKKSHKKHSKKHKKKHQKEKEDGSKPSKKLRLKKNTEGM